jgi:hypothetical protein
MRVAVLVGRVVMAGLVVLVLMALVEHHRQVVTVVVMVQVVAEAVQGLPVAGKVVMVAVGISS